MKGAVWWTQRSLSRSATIRRRSVESGAAAFDAHLHAIKEAGQGKAQAAVLAYRLLLDGPRLQPLLLRFCGLAGAGLERLWREV